MFTWWITVYSIVVWCFHSVILACSCCLSIIAGPFIIDDDLFACLMQLAHAALCCVYPICISIIISDWRSASIIMIEPWRPRSICLQTQIFDKNMDSQTPVLLFFSRPRSEGWPHHGHTFSIYPCPLSFWLTLPRRVLSTSWRCPSRLCVVFLACVHLTLFLALSLSPGNSLVLSWCDHSMLASLHSQIPVYIYWTSRHFSKDNSS